MDSRYILPVSFAAAFHAALLLGIPKSPIVKPPLLAPIGDEIERLKMVPQDDSPDLDLSEPVEAEQKLVVDPPPRSPEPDPTPVEPKGFVTPTPPVLPRIKPGITTINIGGIPGVKPRKGDVIPPEMLDKVPRTRFQPAPNYPFEAKRDGLTGEVVVEFVVDTTGHVHDVRVVSSTHRAFEEPTMRAVSRWIFEPGRRNGELVRFRMAAPVMFRLNE